MKKVSTLIIAIICLIAAIAAGFGAYKYYNVKEPSPGSGNQTEKPNTPPKEYNDTDYNVRLIKTVNSTQSDNYLISPYSIEIALNMLKAGAKEDTYKQVYLFKVYSDLVDVKIRHLFASDALLFVFASTLAKVTFKFCSLQ